MQARRERLSKATGVLLREALAAELDSGFSFPQVWVLSAKIYELHRHSPAASAGVGGPSPEKLVQGGRACSDHWDCGNGLSVCWVLEGEMMADIKEKRHATDASARDDISYRQPHRFRGWSIQYRRQVSTDAGEVSQVTRACMRCSWRNIAEG